MKKAFFIFFFAASIFAADRNVKHDFDTNVVSVPDTYLYLPQDAHNKTGPPNNSVDDITLGYYVGSVWHDTTNFKAYICLDNTDGSAKWKEVTSIASGFVDTSGTPADNQVAVFVDADTVEGNSAFTFDGSTMTLGADFHLNGNGNIGINTTTPTADIDIAENESNFGSINFSHGGAGGHGGKISIYHTGLEQQYQGVIELVDDGYYNADLIYSAKDDGLPEAPLEEKFRFDSSDNIFDITGSLTSSVDLQAPSVTLEDPTHSVRLALDGDRIFHDTNDDGTKDAGEEYIDHGAGGDVSKDGTPVDGQIGIWTGDGTIEGRTALTFDTTDDTLVIAASGKLAFGAIDILSDAAGTLELQNVDAIDDATETALESEIDSLASLTVVGTIGTGVWQGTAIADAYIASAATWTAKQDQGDILDDLNDMLATASAADQIIVSTGVGTFQLETGNTARASLGLAIGTDVQAHSAVLDATTASFLVADETKLDGIEASADVTDTTNVTAAGALMDSEVDADLKTLTLPASVTIVGTNPTILPDGRYRTLWVSAGAMQARTTNGAAFVSEEYATNDVQVDTYLFDGATDEAVQFQVVFPDAWDLSTVKVKLYWDGSSSMTGGGVDSIEFEVSANASSNDEAIDTAFPAAVAITDDLLAIGDVHITAASSAITIGGTPALGDFIVFQIKRDVSFEAVGEDVKLLGALIQYKEKTTETAAW